MVEHLNYRDIDELKLSFAIFILVYRPIHLDYQPPASSTFFSDQTSHRTVAEDKKTILLT
jgi:hypothetical protein